MSITRMEEKFCIATKINKKRKIRKQLNCNSMGKKISKNHPNKK
jgi:hypothetical protein